MAVVRSVWADTTCNLTVAALEPVMAKPLESLIVPATQLVNWRLHPVLLRRITAVTTAIRIMN